MTNDQPIRISYDSAVTLLKRAVLEKGADYVYRDPNDKDARPECSYFEPDGSPSCIVGHVIHYKGVELDDVAPLNTGLAVDVLVSDGIIAGDEYSMDLLTDVQGFQDHGMPWGEAVRRSIEDIERLMNARNAG